MAKYTVRPADSGIGFEITVVGGNGARNTLLGFGTQTEAEAWIVRDKRLNDPTDPFMPELMLLRRASAIEYPEMLTESDC